jgi:hypothetical protein
VSPRISAAFSRPVLWSARFTACFFLIIGSLVFTSFTETGEPWLLGIAVAALGGAALFIYGLERPTDQPASWARPTGFALMAIASLVPSSLLFIPTLVLLFAVPALIARPRVRPA